MVRDCGPNLRSGGERRKRFRVASWLRVVVLAAALGGVAGCGSYLRPFETQRALHGPPTLAASVLRNLPAPQEPVVVAVYRFRDQTGQYRALENVSTFSTAVTQGATSILIRALEESGWFVPIEREGLSNLLNERQIIQSIRAQHTGPEGEQLGPLPPLLYAGIILEGGVIGYDSNVLTGGAGLRYFGAGGSGQVRQDQVTVYLRAVSTQSGRVLKTVYTTKTILSQRIEAGLFRFVELRRLLEAEAGYSFNEPPVVAVTEAIEEAVRALILEGVRDNLWALQQPSDINHSAFAAYDRDVAEGTRADAFGRVLQPGNRPGVGIGAIGGAALYEGDFRNPVAQPTAALVVRGNASEHIGVALNLAGGRLAADSAAFEADHAAGDVHALYFLMPHASTTPFVSLGAGVLFQPEAPRGGNGVFPYVVGSAGIEHMITPQVGLNVAYAYTYPLREGLDGVPRGRYHDSFHSLQTGIIYYMR